MRQVNKLNRIFEINKFAFMRQANKFVKFQINNFD